MRTRTSVFGVLTVLVAILLVPLSARPARPCTTGVASGKATADGRPLLWKNRDTKGRNNEVVFYADGKYKYVAVVGAGASKAAWMGANEAGLCIENSLSKDLGAGKKAKGMDNGAFMKLALQQCATVADFEALLEKTNATGRATAGNIGVIDAQGGAVIFEVGPDSFVRFDANDPEVAPQGYIVRSNFSMTATGQKQLAEKGNLDGIYSGERYFRADAIIRPAVEHHQLDHHYVLRHFARDMADPKGDPYPGSINDGDGQLPEIIDTGTTIGRRTTVSVAVFHGVKPGEDPRLTTMWAILGDPALSIAVPCWAQAGATAAALDGPKTSPLCTTVLDIRRAFYEKDAAPLRTAGLPAVWQETFRAEDTIFKRTDAALARWRQAAPSSEVVFEFHRSMASRALATLEKVKREVNPPAPRPVAKAG